MYGSVIVAVVVVRVVQVPIHQIIDVIAMRHGFMAAVWTVHMARFVSATRVIRRADHRVAVVHCERVLIHVVAVRRVQMPVVQVVHMIVVHNGCVSAVLAVHMRMTFVDFVVAHASTFILGRGGEAVKRYSWRNAASGSRLAARRAGR